MRLAALFLLLASVAGAADPIPPDTSGILSLWGRFSFASGCPVATDLVLTNAHVLDIRPFDASAPLYPYRFEGGGVAGFLNGDPSGGVSMRDDLAWATPHPSVTRFYSYAENTPIVGETLWWVGYERKNRKSGLSRRLYNGRVLRVIAGQLILDTPTSRGSSGSCVLNSRGEVVGLVAWGVEMENTEEVTVAVGVWGEWRPAIESSQSSAAPTEQGR